MRNPELHTTSPNRRTASGHGARFRVALATVLLGTFLPASPTVPASGLPTAAAEVPNRSVERLLSAHRLVRLGLLEISAEHLLAIDPNQLPETHLLLYASILANTVNGILAHTVNSFDCVHRPLQNRLWRDLEDPRLAPFASLWHVRALVEVRRGRVSGALEAWNEFLERETEDDRKLAVFRRAMVEVLAADPIALRYDPKVQDGALRAFIDAWTVQRPFIRNPEVVEAVLAVESQLDLDGPRSSEWSDRLVELRRASPSALFQRGRLELARQRPDMALPWLLWAAYTDSLRSTQSPRSWAALSWIYLELGWCQHASEAFDLSLSKSPHPSCEPRAELANRVETCLSWHDDLLGYSPERLVIAWRGSWQRSVPDLNQWRLACDWAKPNPFANCGRRHKLPRLAAERLSLSPLSPNNLLCTLTQTDLRSKALDGAFEDRLTENRLAEFHPSSQADYFFAWALYGLRRGNVPAARSDFARAFETGYHKNARLLLFARALSYVPGAAGETTLSFLEECRRQLEGDSWVKARDLRAMNRDLTVLSLRMDSSTPSVLRWSDRALIDSPESWWPWYHRGLLEHRRSGPISALPYLIWAYQQMDVPKIPVTRALIRSYSHLRWWSRASELAATLGDEWPKPSSLEPGDLPEPWIPSECRRLHSRLEKAGASSAVRVAGERWRERIPVLSEWQDVCAESERLRVADQPSTRP